MCIRDRAYANPFYDPYGQMNPALRRQYMTQAYYDFSLPWNLGFNYTIILSVGATTALFVGDLEKDGRSEQTVPVYAA